MVSGHVRESKPKSILSAITRRTNRGKESERQVRSLMLSTGWPKRKKVLPCLCLQVRLSHTSTQRVAPTKSRRQCLHLMPSQRQLCQCQLPFGQQAPRLFLFIIDTKRPATQKTAKSFWWNRLRKVCMKRLVCWHGSMVSGWQIERGPCQRWQRVSVSLFFALCRCTCICIYPPSFAEHIQSMPPFWRCIPSLGVRSKVGGQNVFG